MTPASAPAAPGGGDVAAVIALLTDSAWLAMPRPRPSGAVALTLSGDRIAGITRSPDPRLPRLCG
jgi:hypothetical protein